MGDVDWTYFQFLCQQRFGPAIGVNHVSDLARLSFGGTVETYQEAFLARMAHVGPLSPLQQAQLSTGGLPGAICIEVELHTPQELQRAMALAQACEHKSAALALQSSGWPPRSASRPCRGDACSCPGTAGRYHINAYGHANCKPLAAHSTAAHSGGDG